MKVYVHIDEVKAPSRALTTIVVEIPSGQTFTTANLLQHVATAYTSRHKLPEPVDPGSMVVTKQNKKQMQADADICKEVQDKSDLYVAFQVVKKKASSQTKPPTATKKTLPQETQKPVEDQETTRKAKEAQDYQARKQCYKARDIYKALLKKNSKCLSALNGLVDIYLAADQGRRALSYAKSASSAYPDDLSLQFRVGQCHLKAGEPERAITVLTDYMQALRQSGKGTVEQKHAIQVALSQAYQQKGEQDVAIVVAQGVIRENKVYLPALIEYAHLTFDLGDKEAEDAGTILLTALVERRGDRTVEAHLGKVCSTERGLAGVKRAGAAAFSDPKALSYLAIVLRDNGALSASRELMEQCLELDSTNTTFFLNYMHLMEVLEEHSVAIHKAHDFLSQPQVAEVGGLTADFLLPLLAKFKGEVYLWDGELELAEIPEIPELVTSGLTEEELHLLAICFTLIKVFYVKGALQAVPALVKVLAPVCEGQKLHQTNIRNEAAYFSCINQIVESAEGMPNSVIWNSNFVYFLSDSHCVTPAWRPICYKGSQHIIHPVLSTGTKIWHLREASNFYPKQDFLSAISVIPDGAAVIVNFGEIDCREALLQCVEKCRYKSLEDAIEHVVNIYMEVLTKLHAKHKWTIYVHPVPPVLDITRSIVLAFNKCLAAAVLKKPHLKWLDILHSLLTSSKSELKPEYEFDKTHLNPSYVSLLEDAMSDKAKE